MVVNYVATSGLTVLIIVVYFVTVYDPSIDPFDAAPVDRPNSLDYFWLKWLQSGPAYISKRTLGRRQLLSPRARSQLERLLIKVCIFLPEIHDPPCDQLLTRYTWESAFCL